MNDTILGLDIGTMSTKAVLFDLTGAELCTLAGIEPGQLSPMLPAGAVVGFLAPEVSRLTGLPVETLVVNGGHGQGCTALGLSVTDSVGLYVIDLLRPFGARVLLYDPYVSPEEAARLGVTEVDLDDLLLYANRLCNLYGLDTISTGVVAFAMELHEKGLLDDDPGDPSHPALSLDWGWPTTLTEFRGCEGSLFHTSF
jgi:hypothetical protein